MRLASLILAGLLLATFAGCSDKSASEASVEIPPEAQVLLDELNALPPETASRYSCPTSEGVVSEGGIVPFIAYHKQKLKELGFEARWNCEKMQYEAVPGKGPVSPICDCPRDTEDP
jgi:hypothetical protein